MKKTFAKLTALGLSAVLILGGAGAYASAAGSSREPAAPAKPAASAAAAGTAAYRDETVYVLSGAGGEVEKVIVSGWLKNPDGLARIMDTAALTGAEDVKGGNPSTPSGEGRIWDADGGDVYSQGTSGKDLPVSVSVSYKLDGQAVTPDQLAGKSGKVAIRFDYANRQFETATIDGVEERICVPFAVMTAVLLDGGKFSNVDVTNGRIYNDGDRLAVVGLALPGLRESLALEDKDIDIPAYVELTADVTDFSLETTYTVVTNSPFTGLDTDHLDGAGELSSSLSELEDAMHQLMDGSDALYGGLGELLDKSGELSSGVDQLADGAKALQSGAGELKSGAAQLQQGSAALQTGLEQLTTSNDTLNGGAKQVFDTLLASATQQLTAAGAKVPELTAENYGKVLDGVAAALGDSPAAKQIAGVKASLDSYNTFYQGLAQYTAGVAQAAGGAAELTGGADSLSQGAAALDQGAAQLSGGLQSLQKSLPALVDGVTQLHNGAGELSGGLDEFNREGVQKIIDAFDGDLEQLAERVQALADAAKDYRSFSGGDEPDGQVKFIYRTAAIEAE